jgi:hypothetical protein
MQHQQSGIPLSCRIGWTIFQQKNNETVVPSNAIGPDHDVCSVPFGWICATFHFGWKNLSARGSPNGRDSGHGRKRNLFFYDYYSIVLFWVGFSSIDTSSLTMASVYFAEVQQLNVQINMLTHNHHIGSIFMMRQWWCNPAGLLCSHSEESNLLSLFDIIITVKVICLDIQIVGMRPHRPLRSGDESHTSDAARIAV